MLEYCICLKNEDSRVPGLDYLVCVCVIVRRCKHLSQEWENCSAKRVN
jgi:hypothetical protein